MPRPAAISPVMKQRTRKTRPGGLKTVDRPRSIDEIDLERIIWDPEYRRAVKPLLGPTKTATHTDSRRGARRPRSD